MSASLLGCSTRLSAAQLAGLARELPAVQYVKVEMPGTAAKLREVIALAGGALPKPTRDGLLELARRRDPLVLRWAR